MDVDLLYVGRAQGDGSVQSVSWPRALELDMEIPLEGGGAGARTERGSVEVVEVEFDLINRESVDVRLRLSAEAKVSMRGVQRGPLPSEVLQCRSTSAYMTSKRHRPPGGEQAAATRCSMSCASDPPPTDRGTGPHPLRQAVVRGRPSSVGSTINSTRHSPRSGRRCPRPTKPS